MPAKKTKPKRAGRPKLPAEQRARPLNTSLPPAVYDWLASIGDRGSASNALRAVAVRAHADFIASKSPEKQGA